MRILIRHDLNRTVAAAGSVRVADVSLAERPAALAAGAFHVAAVRIAKVSVIHRML